MMKKRLRWLMMPLLAALLVSAAGAAEAGTEQVLRSGCFYAGQCRTD